MKKIFYLMLLVNISLLGMKADSSSFDLISFLKEHKWHSRKDALSIEQRTELAEYIGMRREEFSLPIGEKDLGNILVDGLGQVEKKGGKDELKDELSELPVNFYTYNFRRVLSDKGQVAGFVSDCFIPKKSGAATIASHKGSEAAIWDLEKGTVLSGIKDSAGMTINNNNDVAIAHQLGAHFSILLWDTVSGDIQQGPAGGTPVSLSDEKKIFIRQLGDIVEYANTPLIWDFKCGAISKPHPSSVMQLAIGFNHEGKLIPTKNTSHMDCIDFNNKGSVLCVNCLTKPATLYFLNKILFFPYEYSVDPAYIRAHGRGINARINGEDEIATMLKNKEGKHIIAVWSNSKISLSNPLEKISALSPYSKFLILGFNNKKQVLLQGSSSDKLIRLFLCSIRCLGIGA